MNIEDIKVELQPKIVFMGTPSFAVPVLEGLIEKYGVKMIVTQPDKPAGRKLELKPSPIKMAAEKHNILCLQPNKISEILQDINQLQPDLIITCAYGQILPIEMLTMPRLGCINVHASLLPYLRGGAPIHHAIIDGYDESGVTIMYMDQKMDTGDIISQRKTDILPTDTTSSLHDRLMIIGRDLLLETMPSILNGTNNRIKQDESIATYGFAIRKEEEKIVFGHNKRQIINQIRGLNSYPGAYCFFGDKRLKVWSAYRTENLFEDAIPGEITAIYSDGFGVKVGNGEVVFTLVQLEGKGKIDGRSFVNGYVDLVGKVLK